jgi:hypothetical protein
MHESDSLQFNQQLSTLQIIVGALATGPLLFAAVVLVAIPGQPNEGVMTRMGLIAGFICLVAQNFVGRQILNQSPPPGRRMQVYTTGTIVSAAILEAGVFLNLVVFMLERSQLSLAMAGLLWAAMLLKFPTRGGVERWLEREEQDQKDEAALRG